MSMCVSVSFLACEQLVCVQWQITCAYMVSVVVYWPCEGLQGGFIVLRTFMMDLEREIHSISLNAKRPWVFCLNVCPVLFT